MLQVQAARRGAANWGRCAQHGIKPVATDICAEMCSTHSRGTQEVLTLATDTAACRVCVVWFRAKSHLSHNRPHISIPSPALHAKGQSTIGYALEFIAKLHTTVLFDSCLRISLAQTPVALPPCVHDYILKQSHLSFSSQESYTVAVTEAPDQRRPLMTVSHWRQTESQNDYRVVRGQYLPVV